MVRSCPAISSSLQELIKRFFLRRSFLARGGNDIYLTGTRYGSMAGRDFRHPSVIRNARFYSGASMIALRQTGISLSLSFISSSLLDVSLIMLHTIINKSLSLPIVYTARVFLKDGTIISVPTKHHGHFLRCVPRNLNVPRAYARISSLSFSLVCPVLFLNPATYRVFKRTKR